MNYNKINPKAFSNPNTLQNINGRQIPGTFGMMVNPDLGMGAVNPYMDTTVGQPNMVPQVPPAGVQTSITPDYEINNM